MSAFYQSAVSFKAFLLKDLQVFTQCFMDFLIIFQYCRGRNSQLKRSKNGLI
ncbi:hypothetical protein AC062_0739 [Pasteurellaceae bacterium NI1060]|nr:hypothetical protein AC062_0739 [Pasteurellaceae bacterium NI1060]